MILIIFYKNFNSIFYYSETQSIRRVRSKLKDISRILKDIGGLLGKDENSFEIRISHPGNKTEASFQIERLSNKISVNIVQPLGEVKGFSKLWKRFLFSDIRGSQAVRGRATIMSISTLRNHLIILKKNIRTMWSVCNSLQIKSTPTHSSPPTLTLAAPAGRP